MTGARSRAAEPGPRIYLDWNATTPPHPAVLDAMREAAATAWGNPSSVHAVGRRARAVIEEAREAVALLAGAEPRDVILTSGATEANNLALRNARVLVTSRLEHPSVVRVAEALEDEGRAVIWLRVPPSGRIEPEDVRAAVAPLEPGFVVALMAANHETGVVQPVAEVAELVAARGGRLHVDAVQAAGKVALSAWRAGDTVSLAAHKLRGPKGMGALVLRSTGLPRPVLLGGAQERGVRPGTVDPIAAAGFAVAARRALDGGAERHAELGSLRDAIDAATRELGVPNGAEATRLPHVTNLSFPSWQGDELVAALDLAGVQVASGSACSAGTSEPSPVITAMLGDGRARSAVRFSLGEETTSSEVLTAITLLIPVLARKSPVV